MQEALLPPPAGPAAGIKVPFWRPSGLSRDHCPPLPQPRSWAWSGRSGSPSAPSLFCHHNGTDFPPTLSLLLLLLIVVTVFLNDYFLKMFVSNFY